ncbi:YIP1 family protein [Hymenobacter bucti]|uniref:YIP1 family protein n=1 Tax=Hymenobacter bucti TaxID=1844114 RepID=A0ABW4QX37_9BACT
MHKVLPYSDDNRGITKRSLLASIWRRPQATLAFILAKYPDDYVSILFFLGGIARAVERAISQQRNDKMNVGTILLLAVVMGSISGWITSSIYAWGLTIVGRWLGGIDDSNKFRTVLAWAQVPVIAGLLLLWPALVFLEDDSFQALRLAYPLLLSSVLPVLFIAKIALGSWSIAILLKGVALIQGFSIARALVNILLPGSLVVAFVLLIAGLLQG